MVTEKGRRANYNFTEKVVHCPLSSSVKSLLAIIIETIVLLDENF